MCKILFVVTVVITHFDQLKISNNRLNIIMHKLLKYCVLFSRQRLVDHHYNILNLLIVVLVFLFLRFLVSLFQLSQSIWHRVQLLHFHFQI